MEDLQLLKRVARPIQYDGRQNGVHLYYAGTDVERSRHVWKLVVVEHTVYDRDLHDQDGVLVMSIMCGRKPMWLLEYRIRHALSVCSSSVKLKGVPQENVFETPRRRAEEKDALGCAQPRILWDIKTVAMMDGTFDRICLGKVCSVNRDPLPDPEEPEGMDAERAVRLNAADRLQSWADLPVFTEEEMAWILRQHLDSRAHQERMREMRARTQAMRERNEQAAAILEQVRALNERRMELSNDPDFMAQAMEDMTRLLSELRLVTGDASSTGS